MKNRRQFLKSASEPVLGTVFITAVNAVNVTGLYYAVKADALPLFHRKDRPRCISISSIPDFRLFSGVQSGSGRAYK